MQKRVLRSRILLASENSNKLREARAILGDLPLKIVSLRDFPCLDLPEESGHTMAQNAVIKAIAGFEATGLITIADDSGLEVDHLGGAPGVRSHRFLPRSSTDEQRFQSILHRLRAVHDLSERTARFRCAAAIAWRPRGRRPTIRAEVFEATCEGYIDYEARGSQGFGYDPIFLVGQTNRTMAELSPQQKNRISHRAKALEMMKGTLQRALKSSQQ